jgi:probable HAF family extracellular repeat protein
MGAIMRQGHSTFVLRRPALAALLLPLAMVTSSGTRAAGQDSSIHATCTPCSADPKVYSVITLGGDEYWGGYLNDKGQVAAFGVSRNRFFDGYRWHDVGSLGGGYTLIQAMNNHGVLVGESMEACEEFCNILAFRWTIAGGMRALPGTSVASATAINDHGQIVGWTGAPGVSERAVRWDPDGRMINLGPLPFSLSEAVAINSRGESGGFTDVADGSLHAAKWTPSGTFIDLGSLDNNGFASTSFVNERGDAAGVSDDRVFFWSQRDGMIATGAAGNEGIGHVVGLSDRGEVVGNTAVSGGDAAFLWSRARGLVLLPPANGSYTFVWGMNKRADMVGLVGQPPDDSRAVRWHGLSAPIDLNARLHRPPPGLVLNAGMTVNDKGDIVAWSNAGLVLLRPGTVGTDAPVLGPVVGLPRVVHVGDDLEFTLGFVDNSPTQTHTVAISWDDGCGESSPPPLLQEAGGVGEVRFRHRFCRAGTAGAWIRVSDSAGQTTELLKQTYADDPSTLTLNGKGMLSYARSGRATRPLYFALWVPLGGTAPSASAGAKPRGPFIRLDGPFHFESEQVAAPTRDGQLVQVEGTGRLNGRPGYRFLVEALDDEGRQAAGATMRVRLTHADSSGNESVVYDTRAATALRAAGVADISGHTKVANGWLKLSR